jgi:hypothetical protein
MAQAAPRAYKRTHYRIPLAESFPVMFSDQMMIGEGRVTNLTVFGCTVECTTFPVLEGPFLLRLLLPDQHAALPIELAAVRWTEGKNMGLEFLRVEQAANLRLHFFVWDRLLECLSSLKQENSPELCDSSRSLQQKRLPPPATLHSRRE